MVFGFGFVCFLCFGFCGEFYLLFFEIKSTYYIVYIIWKKRWGESGGVGQKVSFKKGFAFGRL